MDAAFDVRTIDSARTYSLRVYAIVAEISYCQASRKATAGLIPGARKIHGGHWRVPASALLEFVDRSAIIAGKVRTIRDRRSSKRIHEDALAEARALTKGA